MKKILMASAVVATVIMTGCGSSSSSDNGDNETMEEVAEEKLFFFYNHETKTFYTYDKEHDEVSDVNSDVDSINMTEQESARMLYWPHATTDANGTVSVDEKFVFVKATYDFAEDGNLTYDNLIHLGHFHEDGSLFAHAAEEFNPDNPNFSDEIKIKKAAALKALNIHFAEQNEIKEEMIEAVANEAGITNQNLCNFFVPEHEMHDEEEEDAHEEEEDAHEDEARHYALTEDGLLHVFEEGENGLEKVQINISLTDATSCTSDGSGISSAGEHGIYVFLNSTQTLYLIDTHGADFHEHSRWKTSEFLPSGVESTQMISFGDEEYGDHDDHE